MKLRNLIIITLTFITVNGISQTLFVPSGTSGIGSSTNTNVGIGTSSPSNIQGWSKVLDVRGTSHSKILTTTSSAIYRTGIFSHTSWNGGGGFLGTESNHNLHLITNYSPKMSILTNGNVGIGILSPVSKLHVYNTLGLSSKWSPANATFKIENTVAGYTTEMIFDGNELYTNAEMHIGSKLGVINLFKVDENGPVANAVRVDIDGKLWVEEIEVKSNVDADYVFEKDYDLRSLEDVEKFVKTEKHLPDIPSAVEFSKKSQNLAEMDNMLLRKIEELTLYIIEQQKEINSLKEKIK